MSFRCDCCGKGHQPGTKPNKRVIRRRNIQTQKEVLGTVVTKVRTEITKEANLCETCAYGFDKGIPWKSLLISRRSAT